MIGLDTNILVRLLVADDPDQTARAQRFIAARCTRESPGFINCIVLAELVWVLARAYGYSRASIANVVEDILSGDDRVVEHHDEVRAALADYRSRLISSTPSSFALTAPGAAKRRRPSTKGPQDSPDISRCVSARTQGPLRRDIRRFRCCACKFVFDVCS